MTNTHEESCQTVSVRQGARLIGISRDMLAGLVRRGLIPVVRVPSVAGSRRSGRVLILKSDLTRLLDEWRTTGGVE